MSKNQDAKTTFKQNVTCIFLSVRHELLLSVHFETPCRYKIGRSEKSLTCGYVMGANLFSFSFSMVSLSSLKSNLVPTKMIGTFGQWCRTSGYHLALTFSNDAGFTSEKQIRKTSVCG